jgi:hypothetical protein
MERITRTVVLVFAVTLALAAGARAAEAKQYRYVGEHPMAGGVFCHIRAPHVHVIAPAKADVQYRQEDGWSYFVGDPVAYGYDGPKYAYQGAHPIHVEAAVGAPEVEGDAVVYCYLKGPHYHIVAPPPDTHFTMRGDVYWYVGDFPPEFAAERPRLAKINLVYEPIEYQRPIVLVAPPPEWHDVLVVDVHTPDVVVETEAPPPVVEGRVVGGVGVSAGVEVHVPVPVVQFGVSVGAAPIIVEEHRHREVREVHIIEHDHGHHDNGRHRGWGKGKGHW